MGPAAVVTPRRGRLRGIGAPAGVVAAGIGLLVVHTIDPGEPGNYPTCPWLLLTGTFCPGCGTLRMLHALTHGDVATALAMNPFALAMLVVAAAGRVIWAWHTRSGGTLAPSVPGRAATGYLVLVITYWVARNLPGMGWLGPG